MKSDSFAYPSEASEMARRMSATPIGGVCAQNVNKNTTCGRIFILGDRDSDERTERVI